MESSVSDARQKPEAQQQTIIQANAPADAAVAVGADTFVSADLFVFGEADDSSTLSRWLQASAGEQELSVTPQCVCKQVDVMRSEGDIAEASQSRFTAENLPEWLPTQPADGGDDDDDEEAHKAVVGPNKPSSVRVEDEEASANLICASFKFIPDEAVLQVRIEAHTYNLSTRKREHELKVSLGNSSWKVYRGYTEFARLHAELAHSLDLKPFAVPKLKLHTSSALRQRERLLEEFLEECITKARGERAKAPALETFLGLQFSTSTKRVSGVI